MLPRVFLLHKQASWSMIRKSVKRFSEKIMLNKKIEWDDDSKISHPALIDEIGKMVARNGFEPSCLPL